MSTDLGPRDRPPAGVRSVGGPVTDEAEGGGGHPDVARWPPFPFVPLALSIKRCANEQQIVQRGAVTSRLNNRLLQHIRFVPWVPPHVRTAMYHVSAGRVWLAAQVCKCNTVRRTYAGALHIRLRLAPRPLLALGPAAGQGPNTRFANAHACTCASLHALASSGSRDT